MATVYKRSGKPVTETEPIINSPEAAAAFARKETTELPVWGKLCGGILAVMIGWAITTPFTSGNSANVSEIKLGMTRSEVRSLIGNPSSTQDMRSVYGNSEYWYYGSSQVCFDGDRVVSVNRY